MSNQNYNTRQTLLAKIKNNHDESSWADFTYYYQQYIYNIVRKMNMGGVIPGRGGSFKGIR